MQKVYRLLRNNRETGPYSLEELLQQNLKPADLVWVEGKSGSWAYPYEIEALRAFVAAPQVQSPAAPDSTPARQPGRPQETARHIFVRLPEGTKKAAATKPADPLEERAEALRQRVAAQAASHPDTEEPLQTRYNRSIDDVEEEYTHWYYKQKTKPRKNRQRLLTATVLGAALLTGGYFTSQMLLKSNTASAVQKEEHSSEETAKAAILPAVSTGPVTDTMVNTPTDSVQLLRQDSPAQVRKDLLANKPLVQKPLAETPAPAPAETTAVAAPVIAAAEPETKQEEAPAPVAEKKRGGFLGLFRKKEKQPETPTNAESTSARKAKKRDAAAQDAIPLAERIELRSDATRESWMLGVMGQKLTLVNHNPQPVGSASVEVSYYGEDKTLLEKKTIRIANIAAKGQATAVLPDNRVAERVSLKILSAEAPVEK
ncbi:hypothetical protein SAMN05444008_11728 [Cnuella takakiae]|uniref:GYF domain-containing protein n=1 Tax=Cnuella takakiae TaxID=1302690 RepID=A0A1M5GRL5_9BACT|nr:hypothetical protein [Cnuella takakiae]OLY90916.1 hypothetical protein BUE76_02640 [Cnuella takakiae]SHG06311.1 hypothetical protein SAMN05444008_11728 [Cnuella takakiae]